MGAILFDQMTHYFIFLLGVQSNCIIVDYIFKYNFNYR